jgi:hydroxymethylglutaryl-CoA lyase
VATATPRALPALPPRVRIREVGPRDGLQAEQPVTVSQRVKLIEALLQAGVRHIEAVSFVSPRAVPAMAGAAEVLAAVGRREGVTVTALVPNLRGAEMALESGVDEITVTVAASPTYNERNVKMTIEQSISAIASISERSGREGVPVDAVLSCAFGSPYEGDIAASTVAGLAGRLLDAGVAAITLADTTGMGTPRLVGELLAALPCPTGLHLHETRGTGLVNMYAAAALGVERFDTSVGGLGGSPFAAGAAGNLATEEAVALLEDLGVETGISVEAMCDAAALSAEILGHPVPSRVAVAGPRTRLAD